ncbi:DUF3696 domain-containing protein [Thioalkalivibrio sp. HK1]|uniref:DUF3696 domain-containing protein n=1 Tax=Thioalkalivibrio sp. HK1 TaxID=1469245 RepID=UPI00046F8A78|nr:DUF3696 domain-containing protein [Thioalkalivibrio sp. HK1]
MIKRWKIANFKSIRDETELELAPLTIFAGANSSGKSTVLQSILLIAQTLAHKIDSKPIVLNGSLSKLGKFDDLKSNGTGVDHILVGWYCEPSEKRIDSFECELSFDANPSSADGAIYQLQPRLRHLDLTASIQNHIFFRDRSHSLHRENSLENISIQAFSLDIDAEKDKISLLNKIEGFDETRNTLSVNINIDDNSLAGIRAELPTAEIVGCEFHHFLPAAMTLDIDPAAEIAQAFISTLTNEYNLHWRHSIEMDEEVVPPATLLKSIDFLDKIDDGQFELHNTLQKKLRDTADEKISLMSWISYVRSISSKAKEGIRNRLRSDNSIENKMIETIRENLMSSQGITSRKLISHRPTSNLPIAMRHIDRFFSEKVKYLGPLRDEPKALYPLGTLADPADVGLRGEQTAAVLQVHCNTSVTYLPTTNFPEANSESSEINRTTASTSLAEAVGDWAQYLGVAEDIQTSDRGNLGHEIKVDLGNGSEEQDLTHVGVGVSQVLPILVMGLLSKEDTTLIFEQPELHLHPLVQTRLADFFISIALLNRQCIVETHSEHLINRIRFRVAAASVEQPLTDISKIYFVEKKERTSRFKEVVINEYGAVQNWPVGFFDESTIEAENILKEAINKKRARTHKGN